MRCCVPYCENTSTNVSTSESKGISFHGLPSDVRLRAAWLRALGKQHSQLPDPAVVCSQHFLDDEIYETESGLRQIATGAVPSTVQVCMICLDTDNKLYPMSKHKLEEAYERLTGYPLYDQGNLKQTLCVQCVQRLLNFSRFRDKSLRARALMMDLVEKHELITRQHIKMINLTKNQLKSDLVVTMLGPDHCDLYILDSSDKRTESEPIQYISVVKNEESYDSPVDEDMEVAEEDDNTADNINDELDACNEEFLSESEIIMEAKQLAEMPDPLKYETTAFLYSPCSEEFVSEHAYMQHMRMHDQKVCGDADCGTSQVCKPHTAVSSSHSPHLTENKQAIPLSQAPSPSAHSPQTAVAPLSARLATSNGNKVQAEDADTIQKSKLFKINNAELHKNYYTEGSLPIEKNWYTCDVCRNTYDRKTLLVKHIKTHTDIKPFACNICPFKTKYKYSLTTHMRTHTGEKLFTCKLCDYQCAFNSNFVLHMRTHTGEKPYTCKLCEYKFARNYDLIRHMKSHTGEKPFNCELCEYKFSDKRNLVNHMRRTHTGDKSVSCTLCEYKCASNSNLVHHMKTHSASRSYTCKMCNYICARSNHLVAHMRTHTGEKPYACNVCEYKCAQNSNLLSHMRTHTRDKPVSCELCKYKCADERTLVRHMRTHTRGKCFACELCDYKCASSSNFVFHMRTHTGEKPYTCNLCEYKFARNCDLIRHMRTHTGEKPYSCELCKFKCVDKRNLVSHVRRTHSGEKPFSCDLCEIKFAYKYQLVTHMGSHTGERPGVELKRSGVETCSAGQSYY